MSTPASKYEEDEVVLHLIAHQIENLHEDVGDMKSALKDLASAIIKLALVEERQTNAALQQERAFSVIEKLETRISHLEQHAPISMQTNKWALTAVWAAACLLVVLVLKKVSIL